MNPPTTIHDLDEFSLRLIFRTLNVFDLRACARVCLRWYFITRSFNRDQLVLNYGLASFRVTSSRKIVQLINQSRQTHGAKASLTGPVVYRVSIIPIRINDSRILSRKNRNFLRTIRALVFCGNGQFQPDSSFSLQLMPMLRHLEIRDQQFCQFLVRNYPLEKFVCKSIQYLVLERTTTDMLAAFPNLIYLKLDYLNSFGHLSQAAPSTLRKLSHFVLNGEELSRPVVDFLIAQCNRLEHLEVRLATKWSKVSLTYLLANFQALKELNLHFEPPPVHSHQLANLLAPDFIDNRNLKLVVHGIVLPTFESHEHQLNYLNSLDSFLVHPHRLAYIGLGQLNEIASHLKRSGSLYSKINKIELEMRICADVLDIRSVPNAGLLKQFALKPFEKLNSLLIYNFINDSRDLTARLDTIQLLRSMPSTLRFIRLHFNYQIGQTVLDLLPVCFPYLQTVDLIDLGETAYELQFLSALPYLASLRLHFILIEDVHHLLSAIKNCQFLLHLFVVTSPRARSSFLKQLREQIELKMQSNQMKFSFMINGLDGLQELGDGVERLI